MYKLKSIMFALVLLLSIVTLYSCDSGSEDIELVDVEGEEYEGAFEELEKNNGQIGKNRRIGVVREIIKASQDDPSKVEVDRDKLGIE